MKVLYAKNKLTAQDFCALRTAVGWGEVPQSVAQCALDHSLCTISALVDGCIAGMGRLIGDGAMIFYVQDVVVLPKYRRAGVGASIVQQLLHSVRACAPSGSTVTVGLMSALDREGFYERFGFRIRPNEKEGAGMVMQIEIP